MQGFHFYSKARTLEALRPLLSFSTIPDLFYFPSEHWCENKEKVITTIQRHFDRQRLAVRSSSWDEDSASSSRAGAYRSCLHVPCTRVRLEKAVSDVIASYKGIRGQVLIQPMVSDVDISGVAASHVIEDGSPYYVISYEDSGHTDSVTAGTGEETTWLIPRWLRVEEIEPEHLQRIVRSMGELERVVGKVPIEIEFVLAHKGEVILLQVRPISAAQMQCPAIDNWTKRTVVRLKSKIERRMPRVQGLLGRKTLFSMMSDWNPAELISPKPRPLAVSLFRELISLRVWRQAREIMGYRRLPDQDLLVRFGNQPYIDVRKSFNSLLPSSISDTVGTPLVDAWIDRLWVRPELHDKVEFEVAQTCLDFDFQETYTTRYPDLLSQRSYEAFHQSLQALTARCLDPSTTLFPALERVQLLKDRQMARGKRGIRGDIANILILVHECKMLGTLPFAIIARHAFIGEVLLRSLVRRKALASERMVEFKKSVRTISNEIVKDLLQVNRGNLNEEVFMAVYGHLRPGTFDILVPRYDQRTDFFAYTGQLPERDRHPDFHLRRGERRAIEQLLKENGFDSVDAEGLLDYARRAIAGRETSKFVFTRNLSDALESIALWGNEHDLSRDSLSYLTLRDLRILGRAPRRIKEARAWTEKRRCQFQRMDKLKLGPVIRDPGDICSVALQGQAPNFFGSARVEGEICVLGNGSVGAELLKGKIVCLESADPGFDYIFAHRILGLITCFGGPNSHMAIRCAEAGLPAAIGCGMRLFTRVKAAKRIVLDCSRKAIWPFYDT